MEEKIMNILSIDTTTKDASVCIKTHSNDIIEKTISNEITFKFIQQKIHRSSNLKNLHFTHKTCVFTGLKDMSFFP